MVEFETVRVQVDAAKVVTDTVDRILYHNGRRHESGAMSAEVKLGWWLKLSLKY